jgi:hypothetical protein
MRVQAKGGLGRMRAGAGVEPHSMEGRNTDGGGRLNRGAARWIEAVGLTLPGGFD